MNSKRHAAMVEAAHNRSMATATKKPGPAPDWDGKRPGEHPLLPLKPPGMSR